MGPDVTVVWSDAPATDALESLAAWAEARGFRIREAAPAPPPALTVDATIADRVEEEMERGRDAIAALDGAAADRALDKARGLLRDHPELPQGSWLRAEVERIVGTRWRRLPPHDEPRGARAWSTAAALDGGRAAGVGEVASGASAQPSVTTQLVIAPTPADATSTEARLDGAIVQGEMLVAAPGEHQLTVRVGGRLVWAAWVPIEPGTPVRADLPAASPCSRDDLARATFASGAVVATGIRCGAWVFARPLPGHSLSLATCEGASCGPTFDWHVGSIGAVLPPHRPHDAPWPAWATWSVVGASVAAVTLGTLAAAGVFRPTHEELSFTTAGLHVSSAMGTLRLGE